MPKILVVDDELSIRESFTLILEGKYKVATAASGEGGIKQVAEQKIDLAFLDIRMPGLNGLETLKRIKEIDPSVEVIMVTAVNDVQKASEAVKLGARDYIIKPFDVDNVLKLTESILRRKALIRQGVEVQKEAGKVEAGLVGHSEKIVEARKAVTKLAGANLRVLIEGEIGTEKEEVARAIHQASHRAAHPFISCQLSASLSPAAIRTLLFGREKGLTVIDLEKISGAMEEARGGTVFIDHIEYLSADFIGLFDHDVRLIAGTAEPSLAAVNNRLHTFIAEAAIKLPPLRSRLADLPILVNYYLEIFNSRFSKEIKKVSAEVENIFTFYPWPGNLAELSAIIERLVLLTSQAEIPAEALPVELLLYGSRILGGEFINNFEPLYKKSILDLAAQDRDKTAAILGIAPTLL